MLEITPDAGAAIQALVAKQGVTAGGGLRITRRLPADAGDAPAAVSVDVMAAETDLVVVEEKTGARVFADQVTIDWLDDKILHATPEVDGGYRLTLKQQAE